MLSGLTFEEADIASYITMFFGIGVVSAVLGLAIGIKIFPRISRALYSLMVR